MQTTHDLSQLSWQLSGWPPHFWRFTRSMETGATALAETRPLPARVPGSVQGALREAGLLPDWAAGMNAQMCEWVENRHWVYTADLPDGWLAGGGRVRLACRGLDYSGWVLLNGQDAGAFVGSHTPHEFDLTPHVRDSGNRLQIVFDCPPRWLGQFGYTSQMKEWKPRFNYTWDWIVRLVQIGIWDAVTLEVTDGDALTDLRCRVDADGAGGRLWARGVTAAGSGRVRLTLADDGGRVLHSEEVAADDFVQGVAWDGLPTAPWQPNGGGDQPLYTLRCALLDADGAVADERTRRVGFKRVEWRPCAGAPAGADPWVCVVNGEPTFLQGVNWTPIRPNFADVTDDDYRRLLTLYRDLGCNLLRVWGGGFLEKEIFYDLCDELGLLVWQELPLSSSGMDNWPSEEPAVIVQMEEIARSFARRRQHHAALLLWCGGNELQSAGPGTKAGVGVPIGLTHPMMARMAAVFAQEDPGRRFLATSASGPWFMADPKNFGKGVHWDVHGPWGLNCSEPEWAAYWAQDDALFRSETGVPGASGADIIEAYRSECDSLPCTPENPLWRRMAWWIELPEFEAEHGRGPSDLEEYVAWSQPRQARTLAVAARACKDRFPGCGGILIWMGHDSFPCPANTSIIDFWGRPKPAALALAEVFRQAPRRGRG